MQSNQGGSGDVLFSAASLSGGERADSHHFEAVLGQAASAAAALGRHQETISRTPGAAALLSQLQSALQKIPYVTGAVVDSQSNLTMMKTPDSTSSPLFSSSPKRDESIRQQQHQQSHHPHLPFPSITSGTINQQHLTDIESLEEVGSSSHANRQVMDGDVVTSQIIDEHELRLLRGSKSVGATPVNYSTTSGGGIGTSPATTTSSQSFARGGDSTINLGTRKDPTASPIGCTTDAEGNSVTNKAMMH